MNANVLSPKEVRLCTEFTEPNYASIPRRANMTIREKIEAIKIEITKKEEFKGTSHLEILSSILF